MEDVLGLYAEPRDPARPVVCFDEASNSSARFRKADPLLTLGEGGWAETTQLEQPIDP